MACGTPPRDARRVQAAWWAGGTWEKVGGSRPISRVLSWATIHLERASPRASSDLPGSLCGPQLPAKAGALPYLVLLQAGFAVPSNVATDAVRSYRTVSPLPAAHALLGRFAFCCTFRGLAPPRRYLAPRPVEPGLSSANGAAAAWPTPAPIIPERAMPQFGLTTAASHCARGN